MKFKIFLGLALVLSGSLVTGAETNALVSTNAQSSSRISIAQVHSVRLEVEQLPKSGMGIQIRIRDYAAHNWQKSEVLCHLYDISDDGKEAKKPFMSVTLKQTSSDSDEYSGSVTNDHEFAHGAKFKVVYKSVGLPLPISTWSACYYH